MKRGGESLQNGIGHRNDSQKRIKEIIRMPHGMGTLEVTAIKFLYNLRRDGIEAGKGRSLQEDRRVEETEVWKWQKRSVEKTFFLLLSFFVQQHGGECKIGKTKDSCKIKKINSAWWKWRGVDLSSSRPMHSFKISHIYYIIKIELGGPFQKWCINNRDLKRSVLVLQMLFTILGFLFSFFFLPIIHLCFYSVVSLRGEIVVLWCCAKYQW